MQLASATSAGDGLAKASVADTLAFLTEVALPTASKGLLLRRPGVVALAARWGLDTRAVRCMQRLHTKYGDRLLMLAIPGRHQVVVLSSAELHHVLEGAPYPFSTSTREKRAALGHFEGAVSLLSAGPERQERRRLNDVVLESDRRVHSMAALFAATVSEQLQPLTNATTLGWSDFIDAWNRAMRRLALGSRAADDRELAKQLARLRAAANWAFLRPRRPQLQRSFHERLQSYRKTPEPGTLAARIALAQPSAHAAPADQVAHWLFAFESAGIATFRALALVAAHSTALARANAESIDDTSQDGLGAAHPFLRACVLESLRLWPTTPLVLRETTQPLRENGTQLPAHAHVLIYLPYFHRDRSRLPFADRFAPELWLDESESGRGSLIPFSEGPGVCPAHHLVPLLGSLALASLLSRVSLTLQDGQGLVPGAPMPGTLNNFRLRFALSPRTAAHP